ncbi:AcrR family transcriptional regulator [Kibdelosporangium banguiense]|uniref:AcrR family transcriptional regulator n=1 Tax=Kibdelosporangium banguiense TaxID=1365924 RepID=A0ABS4TV06_9PSEU|nr:TetR/AcrR family transcriptional regulator [Kibdelosporangium banguiense]MBP2328248.1 AcrR family transcriptional regulator [Kibdelosporangium banguiense]
MALGSSTGRVNQKRRTHDAIVRAAVELICAGGELTMPAVARAALVSEATAYRYFPDLVSLVRTVMDGRMPTAAEALEPVRDSQDPVERVAAVTEHLMRHVLAYQSAVRAMIAASVTRPAVKVRPALRTRLIDEALKPITGSQAVIGRAALAQLKRDLAIVVSAEALFVLTDLHELDPERAVRSVVSTATTVTRAALSDCVPVHARRKGPPRR